MKIRIIQVGKNKDKYIEEGVSEMLTRLKKFGDVSIMTLKEVKATKSFGVAKAVNQEGEEILNVMPKDEFVVVLDENGQEITSNEFAKFIGQQKNLGGGHVTFIIGGPYGLSESVKKQAKLLLSFSKMTFTHQIIRLILLEQIYRAFMILSGSEYHH